MKTSTRFTDLIGCRLPLQLAAMGGVGTTELAMVVEASGGLGMVPSPEPPASGACGVNFLVPFAPPPEAVGEVARTARVVEFFYGDPDRQLVDAKPAPLACQGSTATGQRRTDASSADDDGADHRRVNRAVILVGAGGRELHLPCGSQLERWIAQRRLGIEGDRVLH